MTFWVGILRHWVDNEILGGHIEIFGGHIIVTDRTHNPSIFCSINGSLVAGFHVGSTLPRR